MSERHETGSFGWRLRWEHGQVLPMTALMMFVLVGFAGLVIDVGRAYLAQVQLQNAVDAAAAVAGQNMPNSQSVYDNAVSYNGFNAGPAPANPGKNALTGFEVSSTSDPTAQQFKVTFKCETGTTDISSCGTDSSNDNWAPSGNFVEPSTCPKDAAGQLQCNAVTVSETANVTTTFAHLFLSNFTVTASATASAPSQAPTPIDLALVIDTTGSMGDSTPNGVCPSVRNPDKLDCVKAGVQALLQTLDPCNPGSACAGTNTPLDKVELLIFPGLTNPNLIPREEDCTQNLQGAGDKAYDDPKNPGVDPFATGNYTFTVVPWESSFADWSQPQGKFVLNQSDPLVKALQTGNCGLESGGDTSYTSVLQTAQDSLAALGNDGASHAIVVLGDGEANYGPIYTSPNEPPASAERHTPCQQAVNVGQAATTAGTTVYTVGYWSPPGRLGTVPDEDTQCLGMNGTNACRYKSTVEFNGCDEVSLGNPAQPWPSVCPSLAGLPNAANPIRGCWTMYYLASNPNDFFPDASDQSLTQIFQQIGQNLGSSRLINSP